MEQAQGGEARSPEELLRERFPEMRPLRSPPLLLTMNGFGLTVYGSGERDRETGTHVKTHFLVGLFIPVLALGAYRVADAPNGGWYFLGKVPLGTLARWWNKLVVSGVITAAIMIGWSGYTSTPGYRAQAALSRARALEAAGDLPAAARGYLGLLGGPCRQEASVALEAVLDRVLSGASAHELLELVQALRPHAPGVFTRARVDAAVTRAQELRLEEPRGAIAVMDALRPLAEDAWMAQREPLLEALLAREPGDLEATGELAGLLWRRSQTDRCRSLLEPMADRLGATEGARVLGLLRAAEGDLAGARALLVPYLRQRLPELHDAERSFQAALQQAQQDALVQLQNGAANRGWYQHYETLDEEGQREAVGAWIRESMLRNGGVIAARERLDGVGELVGLALDVGTLLLTCAQELQDEERQREVEAAEQLFLAVQGIAGDSPTFRLGLARVHYWLGRPQQGRELLEEVVAGEEDPQLHLAVAKVLREVGAQSDASALAEKVWEQSHTQEAKESAAGFLAYLVNDLDERLVWFERANVQDPADRASLLDARAQRALRDGDRESAEGHLRAAADLWAKLPPQSSVLNNRALNAGRLFLLSGRPQDLDTQIDLLLQAERLEQGNSLIKGNLVWALLERAALRALAREGIDAGALRIVPGPGHLDWACSDGAGLARVGQAWAADEDIAEALTRLRALRVLAPRDPDHHAVCLTALGPGRDPGAHQDLLRAIAAADLDLAPGCQGELAAQLRAQAPAEEREREAVRRALEHQRALLAALPREATPRTRAMARGMLVGTALTARELGEPIQLDQLIDELEAILTQAPSLGALDLLTLALLERAVDRTAGGCPSLAAMRQRAGRSLGAALLVPLALEGPDEARAALLEDPDLRRAATLLARKQEDFPRELRLRDWALLRAIDPAQAERLAQAIRSDPVLAARVSAHHTLEPVTPGPVTSAAWLRQVNGEEPAARQTLQEAIRAGMIFPYDF